MISTLRKILIAFILISTSYGKIGDSIDQCKDRYGKAFEISSGRKYEFEPGGISITCWFSESKCESIIYQPRKGSIVIDVDAKFSKEQSMKILSMNSKSPWKIIKSAEYGEPWNGIYLTEDGLIRAVVNFTGIYMETVKSGDERNRLISKENLEESVLKIVKP